ncbi:DUF1073 domain-containing protein [Leisingera sp. ANG-Vp]|uniref:DUF1073 domain-containing protein n=1 Tax=Leisingera sp. ANG-Vp TaxID=1577896 RepID=UPI000A8B9B78|nr:anti-CBASS Acb1 family protein [Leisingera sp. ANG-Vp]
MSKPHYRMTADGQIAPVIRAQDGFQNLVANLGTARDKAAANGYFVPHLSDLDLLNAYRGSSVAKAVVDVPAEDACREWREWHAKKEQIETLEAEESRLGIVAKVLDARKRARLYGAAAIYIGTGESDPSKPLSAESIRKGDLKYLTVLDRIELGVNQLQLDPSRPGYGLPEMFQLSGASGQVVDIHPSRLVLFKGEEIPNNAIAQSFLGWGDSVLQTALEKVGHLDGTVANVASLVFEAKVDVVKIADFTESLRNGGQAYEQLMLKRFNLAMTAKGINGALMLDAKEEYHQKSANFSTLPDIIDRFMQMVSAASEIPMTRLFGMSPGGMNATGESDLRNYYDRVKREQTLEMQPALRLLDECLIRSALGVRPPEVHFTWRPLWQLSEKEIAENADKLMSALEKLERMGNTPAEAISKSAVNALTESGAFPGLEGYAGEFGGGGPDDDDESAALGKLSNQNSEEEATES